MQYEPIKKSLGRVFARSLFLRKTLYFLLDLLLLRTWHVKRALRNLAGNMPENASVLDAGSGFGQYTWRMSRMKPEWKIKAVAVSNLFTVDVEGNYIPTRLHSAHSPSILSES